MEEQLNSCWNRHIFLAGIRLFGNMIFLGTNICHRKCIIIAFIPTSCLYCFFIFLPKVRETWQPHVWTFTEWVSSFKQTVKRRSKGIFREHCMHSALMRSHRSRPQTVAQISLFANKPMVLKTNAPLYPSGMCKLWKYGKTWLTPLFAVCTMHLQKATELALCTSQQFSFIFHPQVCSLWAFWGNEPHTDTFVLCGFDRSMSPVICWMLSLGGLL